MFVVEGRVWDRREDSSVGNNVGDVIQYLTELHADLFSRHATPLEVYVLWRSTKEVKMLCLTRFVVMQRKTAKEEAWRPMCAAPRLVYDCTLLGDIYARTRAYDQIYSAKKKTKKNAEVGSRDGHVEHVCKISGSIS